MHARPVLWLMLALTVGGSVMLRVLAARTVDNHWQPAVYRYPADGMPACADLTGHAPAELQPSGRWTRAALPEAQWQSPRGCLLRARTLV